MIRSTLAVYTWITSPQSPRHPLTSRLNALPDATHPSRLLHARARTHTHTRIQAARHRGAAVATSHHAHTVTCCPTAQRPSVSQYLSDGRDCRLSAHMRSSAERRGGRGRERDGRSRALAEEDGRERVVLADWRHVGRGLVGGVSEFVEFVVCARLTMVRVVSRLVAAESAVAVHARGGVGKATGCARSRVTP